MVTALSVVEQMAEFVEELDRRAQESQQLYNDKPCKIWFKESIG